MRFKEYLNEQNDGNIKEILEKIKKDCQPFLKDLKKASPLDDLLYSGRKKSESAFKGTVRKNRNPKDTPLDVHNWLDNWFEENFGIKARSNSIITTGDSDVAKGYGNLYVIFPIGNYEIIWSPRINDLYTKLYYESDIAWGIITTDVDESAPYMESFFKDIKSDWVEKYGEYSGNGKWVYNNGEKRVTYSGEWLKHEIAMDLIKNPDLPDDRDEIKEDIYWIPEVKWEKYRNQKLKEMKEKEIEKAKNFLSSYQKNELGKAINSYHEIMLITSEYYAFNIDGIGERKKIKDWLKGKFEINWSF